MNARHHRRSGLSRPEVMVLMAPLIIIISLVVPTWLEWREHQRIRTAYSEIRMLVTAADLYNREYRLWPAPDASARGDIRFGSVRPNREVMNVLAARVGPGNEDHRTNPRQVDFIALATGELSLSRWSAEGDILDPWGRPYQLVFDANYDNICTIPESSYRPVVGEGVVVWSMGRDGRSDTDDDLTSWRR
ncbi:MAG TPA: hypothetical protein PKE26_09395 [Kiritimatiellia bacterium]|nr:hypothetical protein [Kiritimatiellia bacterium]HMO99309.1 hypothetical protein [Kiritimatiellia bacterium]HMP95641.1 hypothetical protein [Kiritimatiellia bacterium]